MQSKFCTKPASILIKLSSKVDPPLAWEGIKAVIGLPLAALAATTSCAFSPTDPELSASRPWEASQMWDLEATPCSKRFFSSACN